MIEDERIATFWAWWHGHSHRVAEAIETGTVSELAEHIGSQVAGVHPDLQWELTPGRTSRHALVVTAAGAPELRPLAERWVRAAPAADGTWEYHPARVPDDAAVKMKLEFGPYVVELDRAEAAITIDGQRQLLDVALFHPVFPEMPEDARKQVTFLLLDWLLGEDGVERWVGAVEAVPRRPDDALPMDALREAAEALARRTPTGEWALLEGQAGDGSVVLAMARRPLKWIDHPLFDQHIAISLGYADRNLAGLPAPEALQWLRTVEDDLMASLSDHAILTAVVTVNGTRTLHLYADSRDPTAHERVTSWATGIADAQVDVALDPGWSAVRPFA